uniref:Uncharacterized protein n=1 Tax=Chromera velia CCMP2878 TaxID=1169474 RepID=A0A0G4FBJ8_9ALVE|mmetsp:Transcript_42605/g.84010  ORF Transcript_42605/g.84010 Transcript_42605/m.84010 type:complete len:114 (+) Transcript_42605:180-521(+)|eukprot:Cvel_3050.t1-p1 / transcript=Cvel_3050.t1 / gene=Cvel_3050 / organism=Chromera_velia_CCMP2878 / gene_product=hypothetical protein / transcript_product=hypothetical protein / location=Cvel_scaffold122:5597-6094(-) / protein_length=113 / sequence_SO=supercontig / SO=protein_coding / is_pseudo=false
MPTIVEGVDFDTVAREWRLKWADADDKKSLAEVQKLMVSLLPEIKAESGSASIQRVVCGGCKDYKLVVALPAEKFGDWEKKDFAPEAKFLEGVKKIEGVSTVETQTYTLMPVS